MTACVCLSPWLGDLACVCGKFPRVAPREGAGIKSAPDISHLIDDKSEPGSYADAIAAGRLNVQYTRLDWLKADIERGLAKRKARRPFLSAAAKKGARTKKSGVGQW